MNTITPFDTDSKKSDPESIDWQKIDWQKIDAVIFDMDGTLVDSMHYWQTLPQSWFNERNLPLPTDLAEQLGMMHLRQAATHFVRRYSPHESAEASYQELLRRMDKHYAEDIDLIPGAENFLRHLKSSGKPACIATMTDRSQVEIVLRRHNIAEYFDFITTTPEVGKGKDCPDIYLQAAAHWGIPPERVAVFEDSRVAAATAIKAGFPVIVLDRRDRGENVDYSALFSLKRHLNGRLAIINDYTELNFY